MLARASRRCVTARLGDPRRPCLAELLLKQTACPIRGVRHAMRFVRRRRMRGAAREVARDILSHAPVTY